MVPVLVGPTVRAAQDVALDARLLAVYETPPLANAAAGAAAPGNGELLFRHVLHKAKDLNAAAVAGRLEPWMLEVSHGA